MKESDFRELCRRVVADYANDLMDRSEGASITPEDVYLVWSCKTLQNSKAMASTNLIDGMYYELTYNGDKHELYLDAYKKFENRAVKVEAK